MRNYYIVEVKEIRVCNDPELDRILAEDKIEKDLDNVEGK